MKQVLCALALLGALLAGAPALAQVFSWDGGGSDSLWSNDSNWRLDTEPPMTGSHDVAIKASGLVSPFQNLADWAYSSPGGCSDLEVVANSSYAMTFRKSGSGDFSTSGRLSLTGFSSTRQATLDADTGLTVTGLSAYSYVTLDVAAEVTVENLTSFLVDARPGFAQCRKVGGGSIVSDSLTVDHGDSTAAPAEHAVLLIDAGEIVVGSAGKTQIYGSPTMDLESIVRVQGGILTPNTLHLIGGSSASREACFEFMSGQVREPETIEMYGFSRFEAFLDVACGGLLVSVVSGSTFDTEARVDVDNTHNIQAGFVQVGGSRRCQLIKTTLGTLETN